jgi:hypothetical protein
MMHCSPWWVLKSNTFFEANRLVEEGFHPDFESVARPLLTSKGLFLE